jgi:hypothetical protein
MNKFQEVTLKILGWLLGIRGEAKIVYIAFDNEMEPTINDLKKWHEENEMNTRQVDKETGE